MGGVGAGTCRDIPAVGVVRIDGDRPRVVAVAALVGRVPGLAGVGAEGGTAAAGFVRSSSSARMPGERVHVRLRAGSVILPALPAVAGAHQAAQLYPNQEQVGVVRAWGDPAHV